MGIEREGRYKKQKGKLSTLKQHKNLLQVGENDVEWRHVPERLLNQWDIAWSLHTNWKSNATGHLVLRLAKARNTWPKKTVVLRATQFYPFSTVSPTRMFSKEQILISLQTCFEDLISPTVLPSPTSHALLPPTCWVSQMLPLVS